MIFLQNENLKLVELIKLGNTKTKDNNNTDPDLSFLLNDEGKKVNVLVDSLQENHNTNSLNAALSKKKAANATTSPSSSSSSSSRTPSSQCAAVPSSAQFTTFTVNQVNVGKNLVNYNLSNYLNTITSKNQTLADTQLGTYQLARTTNSFVDNNSLAFILDSILFKLFLLANNQNNNLIINQQNLVILQKFISNYFNHINNLFLYMTDKNEFMGNFAKFKQQLKHLVAQYNVMLSGNCSADSNTHEKINENIKINETSICFKIQLLLVIYLGNINYSILYPDSSSDDGQSNNNNNNNMFKFFKLNYDYEFLKKIILEKLNLFKDATPSLEVLQIYLPFFYLSLCYENNDGDSAAAAASSGTSSVGEKFLIRSTKNNAYLVKISQVINNYLVGVLRLSDDDDDVNVQEFRPGTGSAEHFMANYLDNVTSQDRQQQQSTQNGLKVKLYWSTYVLNSFLVLKTGDYFNNGFFRAHYGGINNNCVPDLQSLQSQNAAENLQPMCNLVQLCQSTNSFILGLNAKDYDSDNENDEYYHFYDGEGKLVKIANENNCSGNSALPNWENELWLLSDAKLTTLDQKLTTWKQSQDDASNLGMFDSDVKLEAGNGNNNTSQPCLPDIQLNLVYLHLRSLIYLKKMKFGTTLSNSNVAKSTADVNNNENVGDDSVMKFASISREFLSCFILVDYINNNFHDKAGNGNDNSDADVDSEEPTLKRRKYSFVSTTTSLLLSSSSSSPSTMLCDYDLAGAVKKNSAISVKSIEQEFISSIMPSSGSGSGSGSGPGSGSGSASTSSSLPFSSSSLNKNIDMYFQTANNHSHSNSNFSLSLFFKSMNSILESSAKRRRAHLQQQQDPNASSTSSSSSSSFKNGLKVIPIDILQSAMFHISTLVAILKNGYYEAQSDLFNQSVKVVVKVLVILIKNYEFDSLSTGNAGRAGDGYDFWYKDWFKRIELDLMSLAGLTNAHGTNGSSAASSSPAMTMKNKHRSSSMVSKRPSISLSNNTNTGLPSSSPLSSSYYHHHNHHHHQQQQQHTASPSISSYYNSHNGGAGLSLNTANLATANNNNHHQNHHQNHHPRSHRSDSTSTTSTSMSMSMSMSMPMTNSMSVSTTVPPTASSSIDMSMSTSMPMSLDMSPTSSINSLFSTSSSSLGHHHRNRRDSISTAGSSVGGCGSYGSAGGIMNSSAGQNPRKRMNSMSVLENSGDGNGNGNAVNNILKQSLMMKRNSSSAVARPTMHPNCSSFTTALAPAGSSGADDKSNDTGHDDDHANNSTAASAFVSHENHETNGNDEQDDDFNLNSLFDWNKVGAAGSANANASLNPKDSATIDDHCHNDNHNQYLVKEVENSDGNDAIIVDAEASAGAGADASDKNVSINNLVDNLICPKYPMNFFNGNGDDAGDHQKSFKKDNAVSNTAATAAATATAAYDDDNDFGSRKGPANVDNHNEDTTPLKTKKALFLKASLSPTLPSVSTAGKQTQPEVSVVKKKINNDDDGSDSLKHFRLDYGYNHDYDDSDEMTSAPDVNINEHVSANVNSTGFSKNPSFLNMFQAIEKDFVNASAKDEGHHDDHDDGQDDVPMSIDNESGDDHDENATKSKQEVSLLDMGKKFNDFNLILEH